MVRAYRLLAMSGRPDTAYNVCSGRAISIRSILELLLSLADCQITPVDAPDLYRPVDLPELCGDASLIRRDTGWEPLLDIQSTLTEVLEDARRRLYESSPAD